MKLKLIALSLLFFSAAHADQLCGVMGSKPESPDTFDQLIDQKRVDLTKGPYLFEGPNYRVAASQNENSNQIFVYSKTENKIFSGAVSKSDFLIVFDGQNQITVTCTK